MAAAVEYLRESYGPTPQAFIDGIGRANQVINTSPNFGEPGFRGNVYTEGIAGAPTSFG